MGATFNHEDYLAHHGIKGQKWGVRRFQNPDGSLTPAGRERYNTGGGRDKTTYGSSAAVATKPTSEQTSNWDHSKSDKSPAAMLAANVAFDLVTLNPVGAVLDVTRAVQAANAVRKEKANDTRMSELKVDKETGLHLKASDMSPEEDLKHVNPGHKNLDNNTKNNCMLCTIAYEMRRRGYDVTANKASYGYSYSSVKEIFPDAKIRPVEGSWMPPRLDPKSPTFQNDLRKMRLEMLKNGAKASRGLNSDLTKKTVADLTRQPNGARGNLMVQWGDGGGHSVFYEIDNGKLIIRDAQTGKTYNNPAKIINHATMASYARIDNLDFDKKKIKEAVR